VASDSTCWRVLDSIGDADLDAIAPARAAAREVAWAQRAAATFKHTFGFHPVPAFCDNSNEALAGMLRPGNAGGQHRRGPDRGT
jgi:hypothetical protein